jgi:site-specific recombinase XerD
MLEKYFVRPETADRIRCSWIADSVERYVTWLSAQRYSQSTVKRRVPTAVAFGDFAKDHGAEELQQLPDYLESFAQAYAASHGRSRKPAVRAKIVYFARNIARQMLRQALPGYVGPGRSHRPANAFERQAPRFFEFLRDEKGLRPASIRQYQFHLRQFATHLQQIGVRDVARVTPLILSNFIAQYGPRVAWSTVRNACGTLRVFLRYLHREGLIAKDLSPLVEFPQHFRHSGIPRSISWDQVERVLAGIDRRSHSGKRDFAMLGMLATYGLRACEVAALKLDDIDWRNDRIKIRERKAGNTTTYPLATAVGGALIDYIKNARPATSDRHGRWRPSSRSARQRLRVAPHSTFARPGSKYRGLDLTRSDIAACSDLSMPTSLSSISVIMSVTAMHPPPRSTPRSPSNDCAPWPLETGRKCYESTPWLCQFPRPGYRAVYCA